jgi:hypothetical protein
LIVHFSFLLSHMSGIISSAPFTLCSFNLISVNQQLVCTCILGWWDGYWHLEGHGTVLSWHGFNSYAIFGLKAYSTNHIMAPTVLFLIIQYSPPLHSVEASACTMGSTTSLFLTIQCHPPLYLCAALL